MTTTSSSPFPWQLYLFALLNVAGGIVCCFNSVCDWAFGKCSAEVEYVMLRGVAVSMLFVGVLFLVLTYINHVTDRNAAKLKRLAMVATQCTVALFVAVIMIGPRHLDGVEKGWAHLGDMITMAVLLVIMWTAIADDKEVAGVRGSDLYAGLGVNPKTLLWLFLVWAVVKLFLLSDFMSYTYMLNDIDAKSELARVLWNLMAVFVLMSVLIFFFAIAYGDYRDQEWTVIASVIIGIVAGFAFTGSEWRRGLLWQWVITASVLVVVSIVAIVWGRRSRRTSGGYTEVGDV